MHVDLYVWMVSNVWRENVGGKQSNNQDRSASISLSVSHDEYELFL
jgi:hypothetical protein